MEFDKTDQEIINGLIEDSSLSLKEIASTLGLSFVTVQNRIKRLEKEGIISKYTARIDYEKIGFGITVLIELRISKGKLFELEKKVAKSPNVYAVYDTTGEYDATVLAKFKTARQLDSFVKHIQTFDFVERTNTKLVLNTIKEDQIKL